MTRVSKLDEEKYAALIHTYATKIEVKIISAENNETYTYEASPSTDVTLLVNYAKEVFGLKPEGSQELMIDIKYSARGSERYSEKELVERNFTVGSKKIKKMMFKLVNPSSRSDSEDGGVNAFYIGLRGECLTTFSVRDGFELYRSFAESDV